MAEAVEDALPVLQVEEDRDAGGDEQGDRDEQRPHPRARQPLGALRARVPEGVDAQRGEEADDQARSVVNSISGH